MTAIHVRIAAVLGAAALGLAACGTAPRTVYASLPAKPGSYVGVYESGTPGSYRPVSTFAAFTGARPRIAVYYGWWGEPFQSAFARSAREHGSIVLAQIDPTGIPVRAIARGTYDAFIRSCADQVRAFRYPVIISFGHEMNGDWYSWGYHRSSAAAFVAAWRHIVTIFRAQGARNVTWLWTVNIYNLGNRDVSPIGPWWPGASYVTWVGIDGYFRSPSDTFSSVFGPTMTQIRQLTAKPVMIAETGVSPGPTASSQVADLFVGIRQYGLLGLTWFDARGSRDWRLKDDPAALVAFRQAVRAYQGQLPQTPESAGAAGLRTPTPAALASRRLLQG